jgi:hypothetical protein
MKALFLAVVLAITTIACATTPQSPQQVVYATQSAYIGALGAAVRYKELPPCPKAPVCSDAAIVAKIQDADKVAFRALELAQNAVRTPGFGEDRISTAVITAKQAVQALVDLTVGLGR